MVPAITKPWVTNRETFPATVETVMVNDSVASGVTPLDAVTVMVPVVPTSAAVGTPVIELPTTLNQAGRPLAVIDGVGVPVTTTL